MALPEELSFLVIKAVNDDVSLDDLLTNLGEIDDSLIIFVRNSYKSELLKTVKAAIKVRMTELVIAENADFITSARNGLLLNNPCFSDFTQRLICNHIDLADKRLNSWNDDFSTFYNLLENRFLSISNEAKLINVIIEWFDAGEMSLDVWKTWEKWFQISTENDNTITLDSLRQVQWPPSLPQDTVICKFADALKSIETDDFLEKEKLTKLLKLLLEEPLIKTEAHDYADKEGHTSKTETRTLNVYGRTIYLSTIRKRLEAEMKSMKQMDIIVRSTLFIDCDLTDSVWRGKNIAIVADKVNVCGERVIDVSAICDSNKVVKRAMNGTNGSGTQAAKNGHDGRDGRAGESSGGITIAASDMSNPEQLTLKLVGGDGDNGESGGNGGDGVDGKGINRVEFDELLVNYESSDDWSLFENYQPPSNWNKTVDKKCNGLYIHYVFKDDDGRELHYDFSKNKKEKNKDNGELDLVLLVKGTDGTSGGMGGLNGKGGEGGSMGECIVINPESKTEYPVYKIQRNGNDGLDGEVGECGKHGINGNYMAVIDRLADGKKNQQFYGRGQIHRLKLSYHCDNGEYRRFICYRNFVENKRDCYVEVSYGEQIYGNLRQYKREKKEERSSEAQMKMKQSIVWSQLMHKAQEHRSKVDCSMNIATVSMLADKFETFKTGDEVESIEVTKVQQEVMLLKEVENDLHHSFDVKVQQDKRSPMQFVEMMQLQKDKSPSAQQIVDYFSIEFDESSLTSLLTECPLFKDANTLKSILLAAIQDPAVAAELNVTQLKNLATHIHERCKRKIALTKFRNSVANFTTQCHCAKFPINTDIEKIDNEIHHVKLVDPSEDEPWHPKFNRDKIQKLIDSFFNDHAEHYIDCSTLTAVVDIFNTIEANHGPVFAAFDTSDALWKADKVWNEKMQAVTENDINVKKLMVTIANDYKRFTQIFEPFRAMFKETFSTDESDKARHEAVKKASAEWFLISIRTGLGT